MFNKLFGGYTPDQNKRLSPTPLPKTNDNSTDSAQQQTPSERKSLLTAPGASMYAPSNRPTTARDNARDQDCDCCEVAATACVVACTIV